jgi:phenylalanyl-tRNA synthetase beta chain
LKISLNWLKEYIDLDDLTVDEIEDKLTTAGLEVDDIEDQNKIFENFVIGFVKEKVKHPNADKLSLCKVNDGENELSVVCGAPNVDANQKIVLAKVGATIPGTDFTIKSVKLRGEKSEGMICSEKELGISDNHDGIMVLDGDYMPGQKLSEALELNDVVFDIDITPNRADALSHVGVARDLSAMLNRELKKPVIQLEEDEKKSAEFAEVIIENAEACPRYVGKVVTGVEIKESPEWMKKRLTSIGLRPINNVVDVTNFVLHELGQPLHAFDLEQLAGNKIVVRNAEEKEKFITLDSKERELSDKDLMICDGEKPVAIAGVMGGENSEVTDSTKNILIESAFFNPSSVRRTSKKLGLSTDSSYRFERGTNPDNVLIAARRAAQLIANLGGGQIATGEIDTYPNVLKKLTVKLRFSRIERILGFAIDNTRVKEIFEKLEIPVIEEGEDFVLCEIPMFRPDIEREIDLIEEIARINGYNNIPPVSKISITLDPKIDQTEDGEQTRYRLKELGFREILTNSLLNNEVSNKFGNPISILNPQSTEMANTRPTLIAGMLVTISKNIKVRQENLRYFEIGHTFYKNNDGEIKSFDDITEHENLLIAITGKSNEDEWFAKKRYYDLYDLKGFVQDFISKLKIDGQLRFEYNKNLDSHFNKSIELYFGDHQVGFGGEVEQQLLDYFDIPQNVYLFNIDLDLLKEVQAAERKFVELLKFPKVVRDFACVLDKKIKSDEVIEVINKSASKLLKNVKLFDIFESDSLGEAKKSLAFQLEFFDETKTLTDDEVSKEFWNAIEAVKKQFNAQLRGS